MSDVQFVFEGRRITAREGDSVASALVASGVRVFGRSTKYHRPRGYRCGRGHCSCCAMRVDGLPGVRTCVTPVRAGMTVEREHAWPSADADLLRAADALSPLLPPGFYYRRFRRSPGGWNVAERLLARVAGQGELPSPAAVERLLAARGERRDGPDVLVVGGGVAGMSAALAAADAGAGVLLVAQDDRLGGRALDVGDLVAAAGPSAPGAAAHSVSGTGTGRHASSAPQLARELAARVLAHGGVETLTGVTAASWYDEGIVALDRGLDLLLVTPRATVLATGGYDRGLPFPGWDLPGVMLAGGAGRLLHRHGVKPGRRAVVVTTDDRGHALARELVAAGVAVAGIADRRPSPVIPHELVDAAAAWGVPLVTGARGARAHGHGRVRAVSVLAAANARRRAVRWVCDLVCVSAGVRPADDLAYQARADGSLVLSVAPAADGEVQLWLAGLAAGATTPASARRQAEAAGRAAAAAVGAGAS